jgi:hypothetical protein
MCHTLSIEIILKQNRYILTLHTLQKHLSQAYRHILSKDDLQTSVDENTCKTGSFIYDSATGVDTAWSCCTVNNSL